MRGNRPSSLPIARFCAKSPALNLGAGRAAAMSSVWHARAAGHPWQDAYLRLTPEERTDIDEWKVPTDITLQGGAVLRFADAIKETRVALGMNCEALPVSDPQALTAGTCDFYWLLGRTLFVGDLKKSEYTEPDGPRSLQVICYALALSALFGDSVDGYVCGIWHAQEGTWEWGEYVALDSDRCAQDWEEVRAAALHTEGDFSMGPHCRRCYARERCPAYLVPPEQAEGQLARYLTGTLDNISAFELKMFLDRVKTTVTSAERALKAHADAHGGIRDGEGKVWRAVECSGRPGLNATELERDEPEVFRRYYKQGAPYAMYRWVNEKKDK